jgi:hypothetical protein
LRERAPEILFSVLVPFLGPDAASAEMERGRAAVAAGALKAA